MAVQPIAAKAPLVGVAPLSRRSLSPGRAILIRAAGSVTVLLGGAVVLMFVLGAVLAPVLPLHDPLQGRLLDRLDPPVWLGGSMSFPLGTDALGRDLLTRIVYGARVSLAVGLLTVGLSAAVGTTLGLLMAWFGGWLDRAIGRLCDLLLAFPMLIFAVGFMSIAGPGFWTIIFALSFKSWVEFARLVRGQTLAEKQLEYVVAARTLGGRPLGILFKQVLPNVSHTVLVLATLRIGYVIIMEASLSFLGLGIQPPTPAWGTMINDGRDQMLNAWWIATFPGLAVVCLVLAINLLGEGLREVLDPRLRLSAAVRAG
ncbi:MAG: ABC transporter permease [Chloroflexi bacterium]|nr:ABC transporter permease [Chloroflexota bacterium]